MIIGVGLVALATNLPAQSNSKNIEFPKAEVTEKFTLSPEDGIGYRVTAEKGKTIKFSVGGSYTDGSDAQGLEIRIVKSDDYDKVLATASPGEEVQFQVKSAGDYEVIVMNPGTKRAKINAFIALE
jgi:hypothetical protein